MNFSKHGLNSLRVNFCLSKNALLSFRFDLISKFSFSMNFSRIALIFITYCMLKAVKLTLY
ncbi:unnamed protein product, partial [Callosobruchus maculatus]